jgi:sugar-specific transcriptional regulator TrmB
MNHVHQLLQEIGLTKTEAQIYLAALPFPSIDANTLSKQTQIKRPTVYHALETLIQKGLATKKTAGNRRTFSMTPPEMIRHFLEQKEQEIKKQQGSLEELIPLLQQRREDEKAEKVQVMHYEGIEGIKMVVDEALYCRSGHWDILAPKKNFFSDFDKAYATYFLETRKRRKITARSLWEKSANKKKTPSRKSLTAETLKERNPRYLPKAMHGQFESVIILFDNKVAIISSVKNLSAVLIQSEEMYKTMSAMFEGLWTVSEPY